jgi:hypothetical protein
MKKDAEANADADKVSRERAEKIERSGWNDLPN